MVSQSSQSNRKQSVKDGNIIVPEHLMCCSKKVDEIKVLSCVKLYNTISYSKFGISCLHINHKSQIPSSKASQKHQDICLRTRLVHWKWRGEKGCLVGILRRERIEKNLSRKRDFSHSGKVKIYEKGGFWHFLYHEKWRLFFLSNMTKIL